jgi:hypothetical protein
LLSFQRVQHDGGVAGGLELLPFGHQALPQVTEIIDLGGMFAVLELSSAGSC